MVRAGCDGYDVFNARHPHRSSIGVDGPTRSPEIHCAVSPKKQSVVLAGNDLLKPQAIGSAADSGEANVLLCAAYLPVSGLENPVSTCGGNSHRSPKATHGPRSVIASLGDFDAATSAEANMDISDSLAIIVRADYPPRDCI